MEKANSTMKKLIFTIAVLLAIPLNAQHISRVEPPNWWVGMENSHVQLMIYGENIAAYTASISNENVILESAIRTGNKNYQFLNLDLSNAAPGKFEIAFSKRGKRTDFTYTYELKERDPNSKWRKGFDSSDVIYLITPDRFANANPGNDIVEGLLEQKIDRNHDYARHGGDIQGITKNLGYISQMGFTAIWPCPVLINDMPRSSYHGYAITDLYKVDPRFGTLEDLVELSTKSRANGMGLIMDQVANHIGIEHWWMKDLPMNNWVNYQEEYLKGELIYSNHRRTTNQDQYAASIDSQGMSDGWFSGSMPDLNQRNPFMATYLIQNSIWWIETLDLLGVRQDTYPYPDKAFMSDWAGAIMKEYPKFSIVGEEWSYNPLLVGYWQKGAKNKDGYKSNLTSSMDFPMQMAIAEGINEPESWNTGFVKLYEGLANDFYYPNPSKIMVFPDNHDMSRIYTQMGEDLTKTKMVLGYLLSLPRIAQLYYGTEILMDDTAKPGDHGLIRTDFPGGWADDEVNAFTSDGLTDDQQNMQTFLMKFLNYRKSSKAIHKGITKHFAPNEGVYILFRTYKDETLVCILNKNKNPKNLELERFGEMDLSGTSLQNIISGEIVNWNETILLNEPGVLLLTTKHKK